MSGESDEVIKKVSKITDSIDNEITNAISGTNSLSPTDKIQPDKLYFDSLMHLDVAESKKVPPTSQDLAIEKDMNPSGKGKSFIEEVGHVSNKIQVSSLISQNQGSKIRDIHDKTKSSLKRIDSVKNTLETPGIRLKKDFQAPLSNKLSSIRNNLNTVSKSAGVRDLSTFEELSEAVSKDPLQKLPSPVRKFVHLLTESQTRLEALDQQLTMVGHTELSPTKLLSIQIKMGHISHELELFSSLLNKALESTKTIMNVQV